MAERWLVPISRMVHPPLDGIHLQSSPHLSFSLLLDAAPSRFVGKSVDLPAFSATATSVLVVPRIRGRRQLQSAEQHISTWCDGHSETWFRPEPRRIATNQMHVLRVTVGHYSKSEQQLHLGKANDQATSLPDTPQCAAILMLEISYKYLAGTRASPCCGSLH